MSTSSETKTRQLLKDLDYIEKKSASLRSESERLRRMKNEAKEGLVKRYPRLFNTSNDHDMSNASAVSPNDDSLNLGSDLDNGGIERLNLSKDLKEVYDMLMKFQKSDSSSGSVTSLRTVSPRPGMGIVKPRYDVTSEDFEANLSELMAAYGVNRRSPRQQQHQQQHNHSQPPPPAPPQNQGYFIPVDYETYSKWLQSQNHQSSQAPVPGGGPVGPGLGAPRRSPGVPANAKNEALVVDDADAGEDTSQDAADLVSQENSKENLRNDLVKASVQVHHQGGRRLSQSHQEQPNPSRPSFTEIGHPDTGGKSTSHSDPEADKNNEKKVVTDEDDDDDDDRDENFVIESDNIDDKLYSSETEPNESPKVVAAATSKMKFEKASPRKPRSSVSSSTSDDPGDNKKRDAKSKFTKPPMVMTLQLQSETDSEQVNGRGRGRDEDISGPEMENDDDFWN